jgi:hypothetical protein
VRNLVFSVADVNSIVSIFCVKFSPKRTGTFKKRKTARGSVAAWQNIPAGRGNPIPYPGRKGAIIQEVLGIGEARRILEKGFISAVESGEAAEILSRILGTSVPVRFEKINLEPGDEAMIFIPDSKNSDVPGFFIKLRLLKANAGRDS